MRKALFAILLACSLIAPAGAQPGVTAKPVLQDYVGDYVLSNGRVLTVSRQRQVLVAQLDGQVAVALKPAGPASFAGISGDLRIDFDQRANGNVDGLTVSGGGAPSTLPAPGRR
jgi:hypothetical protein